MAKKLDLEAKYEGKLGVLALNWLSTILAILFIPVALAYYAGWTDFQRIMAKAKSTVRMTNAQVMPPKAVKMPNPDPIKPALDTSEKEDIKRRLENATTPEEVEALKTEAKAKGLIQ